MIINMIQKEVVIMLENWESLSGKHAYNELYLDDFTACVRSVFSVISEYDCDVFYVLDFFLGCVVFQEVNSRGNPKYLNMGYKQLIECISFDEGLDWKKTKKKEEVDEDILWWVGELLTRFQWRYSIDFRDWLKYSSVKDVYNMYYPLHEASYQVATEKLYEWYEYNKKNKKPRKLEFVWRRF